MAHAIYRNVRIELVTGDIAAQSADAIVNAANAHLAGGGGVDGAIHRRGGPIIMAETDKRYPSGCPTGSAVISGAGNLDAQFVIHAVAPRYSARKTDNAELLRGAYDASLILAAKNGCRSVAFPSLGTGAYSYPLAEAGKIALETVRDFLDRNKTVSLNEIRFVLFDTVTFNVFTNVLQEVFG